MPYQILPSILSANLMRLGDDVQAVMDAGADMIHFDVMDNHYVPNLSFGPIVCQSIRTQFSQIILDVHLMTTPTDDLIERFAKAGANRISIHPDATIHLERSLQLIKEKGCAAGLVLNPANSIDVIQWCEHLLDFVLIMTVNPGFGGQKFIPSVMKKIALIHQQYPNLPICVDGGINEHNISNIARAGATQFVAGSAIFKTNNYGKTISAMRKQLASIE